MFCKFRPVTLLCWAIYTAVALGIAGGCSREHYKADADEEVYKIIDSKWQDSFGSKANYIINDSNIPPSPNDIQIEESVPPSGVISLAEAVAIATANNRTYQSRKEALYVTALNLTGVRHQYARQWFGTIGAEYSKDSSGEETSIKSTLEVSQTQLLANGIQVGARLAIDWARFLTGDFTTLGSVLSGDVAVPLLGRGAGKDALEQLTLAERDVLYQIRSFNRYRKTFVVSIVNDYYRVLQQRDRVTNAESDYKRRVESKERLEMEAEAGRKPPFEVDQAEQEVLRAQNSLVVAREDYQQLLDQFKIRLSLPTDAKIELDQNELEALGKVEITQPDYAPEAAVETALSRRLDLANSRDYVEDAERNVVLAADGLGVQLNLVGSAGVRSAGETRFTRLQFDRGTYDLGLGADLPLDRKDERNIYRRALITLEQQQREYENHIDEVKLDVRNAYRTLREQAESYRIQKTSKELAEKRVESTTFLLQAGRVTTYDLLISQDALLEAQNNVTAALVAHAIAKLTFFQDIGILEVRPDGMWEQ